MIQVSSTHQNGIMTVPVAGFTIPVKYWYFSSLYFCTIKLCAHISIYIVLNEATRNRTFESNYYSLIRKSEDKSVKFLSTLMFRTKLLRQFYRKPTVLHFHGRNSSLLKFCGYIIATV